MLYEVVFVVAGQFPGVFGRGDGIEAVRVGGGTGGGEAVVAGTSLSGVGSACQA
ncbi:hypothetical protein [Streptomyces sp. HUAS TT7]|uniref:hypothetical protein n=1 Tax=Streptomyces sp. HUAS TT7 TaxID=3447507 RepID=UPI003F65A17D